MDTIAGTLCTVFGFPGFREGQQEVIARIMAGRPVLAVFPTGGGKSLCYQLPALHLPGLTLVVSPLLALMKEQMDFLTAKGVPAARLDSTLTLSELQAIYDRLRKKELKLLYVAPERFSNERFLALVEKLVISLLVIDEAHCISEWGHNFRPDYLKLAGIARQLKSPPVLTLTATATSKVAADIMHTFRVASEDFVHASFHRPNLHLFFSPSSDPMAVLLARLAARPRGAAIVYTTLQATAEEVAESIKQKGYQAECYHAGMKDEERQRVQDWFMASAGGIVVATIAFGMGIDKADIRAIYHYNLPKSLENYAQEIGRAGRDGKMSICELLGGSQDLTTLENFVYGDTPEEEAISRFVDGILDRSELEFGISVYKDAFSFDMRPLVVKTLLTYLELAGVISATGHYYASYRVRPLKSSEEIIERFDSARADFLKKLFSTLTKVKTWFRLDLDAAMAKTGSDRRRIVTALNYLEEQGDLELEVSESCEGFRRQKELTAADRRELKSMLARRFSERESNDIARLNQVVELVNHPACKTKFLLHYFGEELTGPACGHCGVCAPSPDTGGRILAATRTMPRIDTDLDGKLRQLISEKKDTFASPRQFARFLCGISSPAITRAKLHRHPLHGAFKEAPFSGVLEACRQLVNP